MAILAGLFEIDSCPIAIDNALTILIEVAIGRIAENPTLVILAALCAFLAVSIWEFLMWLKSRDILSHKRRRER